MTRKNILIKRGERLQNLRKKAGLTRLAFSEKTGMSANTLKALELGDRELTSQKALLFSNLFSSLFSVSLGEDAHEASFDYLYYGKKAEESSNQKEFFLDNIEDARLQNELDFFTLSPLYSVVKMQDDLMSPFYKIGDILAGKKITNKNHFNLYQGKICIIEDLNGEKFLRKIMSSDNQKITCCILNLTSHTTLNVIEEIEAISISQAIWHWHLSELV